MTDMTANAPPLYVGPTVASRLAGLSRMGLYLNARRGRLPPDCYVVSVNGRYLFHAANLKRWAAERDARRRRQQPTARTLRRRRAAERRRR